MIKNKGRDGVYLGNGLRGGLRRCKLVLVPLLRRRLCLLGLLLVGARRRRFRFFGCCSRFLLANFPIFILIFSFFIGKI